MQSLLNTIQKDVFEQEKVVDQSLIQEYFERNERKKEDEKWLKANKEVVLHGLQKLGKEKADFGVYRASVTVPDQSKFDEVKVLEFIAANHNDIYNDVILHRLNENNLVAFIENGIINFDELKEYAWVDRKGTPRINIKQVRDEN